MKYHKFNNLPLLVLLECSVFRVAENNCLVSCRKINLEIKQFFELKKLDTLREKREIFSTFAATKLN